MMRHFGFWLFQAVVMTGVIATFWLLMLSLREPVVADTSNNAEVLAEQSIDFFYPDTSDLKLADVLNEINKQRSDAGLPVLQPNNVLTEEAKRRAIDMQENEYYAHEEPSTGKVFSDSLKERGIVYTYACENLNLSFSSQAHLTVRDWLNSPAHKRCLLQEYGRDVGLAVVDVRRPNAQPSYIIVAIKANILDE